MFTKGHSRLTTTKAQTVPLAACQYANNTLTDPLIISFYELSGLRVALLPTPILRPGMLF